MLLYTILPIISVLTAALLGLFFGCEHLSESAPPDCMGGDLVYSLAVLGWLGVITLPTGLITLVAVLLVHVVWFLARRKND